MDPFGEQGGFYRDPATFDRFAATWRPVNPSSSTHTSASCGIGPGAAATNEFCHGGRMTGCGGESRHAAGSRRRAMRAAKSAVGVADVLERVRAGGWSPTGHVYRVGGSKHAAALATGHVLYAYFYASCSPSSTGSSQTTRSSSSATGSGRRLPSPASARRSTSAGPTCLSSGPGRRSRALTCTARAPGARGAGCACRSWWTGSTCRSSRR